MTAAGIYGTYHDLRPIKTRKVVQLVIEVPVELAPRVVEAFGWPNAHTEDVWLAVARLEPEAVEERENAPTPAQSGHDSTGVPSLGRDSRERPATNSQEAAEEQGQASAKTGRPHRGVRQSEEAWRLCRTDLFWRFLKAEHEDSIQFVRYQNESNGEGWTRERLVREIVCHLCGVGSRSQFDEPGDGRTAWLGLVARYDAWLPTQDLAEPMGEAGA